MLVPASFRKLKLRFSLLNHEGTCFSFDARGSGYGRGEGVAMVVLKRLDDAIRDSDSIRGIIKSTAIGQDGKTAGITLPNGAAQGDLIRSAFRSASLNPLEIGYVEAHGTGTIAGDVTELRTLNEVFCEQRDVERPLYVGSIKANIGHLEATSGLAGVIKALLVLEKGIIPGTPNLKNLKEDIKFSCRNIKVWHYEEIEFDNALIWPRYQIAYSLGRIILRAEQAL